MSKKLHTPCKNCVFAEYEYVEQVGCSRGYLDKYRASGAEIDAVFDEDKEFFVIKDRICPNYRENRWLSRLTNDENVNESIQRMLDFETALNFNAIIIAKEDDDIEMLFATVESLKKQKRLPVTVVIIIMNDIDVQEASRVLFKTNPPFIWKIEQIVAEECDKRDDIIVNRSLHSNTMYQYYTVAYAGYQFESDFLYTINDKVINDILQFAIIEGQEYPETVPPTKRIYDNGVVIPRSVHEHWFVQFSEEDNLAEDNENELSINLYELRTVTQKVRDYQCQNPERQLVFSMEEIRNYKAPSITQNTQSE